MRQTLEARRAMFPATAAVTSWPVWVTPSATTPLSAQKGTTAFLAMEKSSVPKIPAMRTTMSSKSPNEPRGFPTRLHFSCARAMAAWSAGVMAAQTSKSVMRVSPFSAA